MVWFKQDPYASSVFQQDGYNEGACEGEKLAVTSTVRCTECGADLSSYIDADVTMCGRCYNKLTRRIQRNRHILA